MSRFSHRDTFSSMSKQCILFCGIVARFFTNRDTFESLHFLQFSAFLLLKLPCELQNVMKMTLKIANNWLSSLLLCLDLMMFGIYFSLPCKINSFNFWTTFLLILFRFSSTTSNTNGTVSIPVTEGTQDRKHAKVAAVEDKMKNHDSQHFSVPSKPSDGNLRSPICCIIGGVNSGKTKLLGGIQGNNFEEGSIDQQIGATYFPVHGSRRILVIDTPGHQSFNNSISWGSGLCDLAILVVDIMHGLDPETVESFQLLKMRNTQFIVALNKLSHYSTFRTLRLSNSNICSFRLLSFVAWFLQHCRWTGFVPGKHVATPQFVKHWCSSMGVLNMSFVGGSLR